jgi:hypothetical protein
MATSALGGRSGDSATRAVRVCLMLRHPLPHVLGRCHATCSAGSGSPSVAPRRRSPAHRASCGCPCFRSPMVCDQGVNRELVIYAAEPLGYEPTPWRASVRLQQAQ